MSTKQILDDVRNKMESGELKPYDISDNKTYTQMFDKCFNVGVDACIEVAKKHFTGDGKFHMDLVQQSYIQQLEQMKKHL